MKLKTLAWKRIALAGVLGFAGGRATSKLRDHPDAVLPILQVSAASGAVGAVVGWGVSAYRKVPSFAHSLSLAANFAIVSGAFLGVRTVIQTVLENSSSSAQSTHKLTHSPSSTQYISSITSGGIIGALTATISRYGLHSILTTSLSGMGMGLCAQAGYNCLMSWQRRKALQLYYEDIGRKQAGRFDNWTFENFETRFLAFWHQRSESIEVEAEMLSLETAVAEERQKLLRLDKLLVEKGVNLAEFETTTTASTEISVKTPCDVSACSNL